MEQAQSLIDQELYLDFTKEEYIDITDELSELDWEIKRMEKALEEFRGKWI